jgi:hypothetical protein
MKWKNKPVLQPIEGETIQRTYFAFIPITIDNETRWFEKVTVQGYYLHIRFSWHWCPIKFIN